MKFRKKPVVIEAIQFTGRNWEEVGLFVGKVASHAEQYGKDVLLIHTLEGDHRADVGDWIIKGIKGEFYPCKPDIFERTYESADASLDDEKLREEIDAILIAYWKDELNEELATDRILSLLNPVIQAKIEQAKQEARKEIFYNLEFMSLLKNHNHKKDEVKIIACPKCTYETLKKRVLGEIAQLEEK